MLDSSQYVIRALASDGVVSQTDLVRANEHAAANACDVTDSLVELGILGSRRLAIERAKICEFPFVDLTHYEIDFANSALAPKTLLDHIHAFPLFVLPDAITVGMVDPLNLAAIDELRRVLKSEIEPVLCDADQLRGLIARAYGLAATQRTSARSGDRDQDLTTGEEPIVVAVNQILMAAADAGASDIHLNPDEYDLHLRYRVDGVLLPQQGPAKQAHAAIVQRLKVMAHLDLTQTRKPQDGKFRFMHRDQAVDVRLSVVPTIHGENVVLRLLRSANRIGSLAELRMPPAMTAWYEEAISKPHGMILVTGPTGSGKTTTLYTALAHINAPNTNIMTIEDPVEIRLPMVRQIQVNADIGLTFATALRSILRQDPDVVLVGEIRDEETAKIAVQSALTGHLVFSTLHTNDAVSSITRLRDFGLPGFAINNALLCVIAQRLVRKICHACSIPDTPDPDRLRRLGIDLARTGSLQRGVGCSECRSTGYAGRLGVYEMLRVVPSIRRLIEQNAAESLIAQQARREGMTSMLDDGIAKALAGMTSVEEISGLLFTDQLEPDAPRADAGRTAA
jgi:type IV pilus assembly protein PilB